MNNQYSRLHYFFALIVVLWSFVLTQVAWSEDRGTAIATVYCLQGAATKKPASSTTSVPLQIGDELFTGDEITIGSDSRAGVQFSDGLFVRLSANAHMRFDPADAASASRNIFFDSGKAHFLNRDTTLPPTVTTPVVTAAVRGTEFTVTAAAATTSLSVIEGSVLAKNQYGEALVEPGEKAITEKGKAPVKSVLLSPQDEVQWTIEIPPLFDRDSRANASLNPQEAKLHQAEILFGQGQIERAAMLVSEVAAKPSSDEVAGKAEALNSVLALAKNKSDEALLLAEQAMKHAPNSEASALSLSYALQAKRNIDEAKSTVLSALDKNPGSSLLLARAAELELGFGRNDEAKKLITRSLKANSDSDYAHTIMGFVNLFEGKTNDAVAEYQRAIALNSASGLPHLGLGLARIKEGDLRAGKFEIQKAAHLEPTRAIYRSYLGKAFFELDDEGHALRDFNEAIRLDPNDPTPWLYKSFELLSENKVPDALAHIEKSIELNDNRAVYRSSFLLDSDEAVRSAGLSRVFTELGFTEAGRLEAIRSLSKDYTNFSAHRLLADSQSQIFFADAAFSERHIADLMSPLSFNFLSSLGGNASLNEYDALFDRAQSHTAASLTYDGRSDVYIPELVHSGKTGNFGYGLAFESGIGDGSMHGNYYRDYRLISSLRYEIDSKNRIIFDALGHYLDTRDSHAEDRDVRLDAFRTGLAYSYRPNQSLTTLLDASVRRGLTKTRAPEAFRTIDIVQIQDGFQDSAEDDLSLDRKLKEFVTEVRLEGQQIYQSEYFTGILGVQSFFEDADRSEESLIQADSLGLIPAGELILPSAANNNLSGSDEYFYGTLHPTRWADVTAGLVRSDIETGLREVSPYSPGEANFGRWNPKFGITLNPCRYVTIRSAYFEELRKASLEDQTSLEPTLLGGIPQRFNDLTGSRSENYGVGVDVKLPSKTYFGGEMIHRRVREPLTDVKESIVSNFDTGEQGLDISVGSQFLDHVEQDLSRVYLYQVFSPTIVGTLDYTYGSEKVLDPSIFETVLNHRISSQLKYFHSSGLFSFAKANWHKQHGINNPVLESGDTTFWTFDAGLGYRLRNRKGILSLEVQNLSNKKFSIDQEQGFEDQIHPQLAILAKASVNF